MKVIFIDDRQMRKKLKDEIVDLIHSKLTELNFAEKIEVDLPRLIMSDIYERKTDESVTN